MTTAVVIDASAGVELLLGTAAGEPCGPAFLGRSPSGCPEIYYAEVAGALRRAELSGRLSSARTAVALDRLLATPMRRVQVTADMALAAAPGLGVPVITP